MLKQGSLLDFENLSFLPDWLNEERIRSWTLSADASEIVVISVQVFWNHKISINHKHIIQNRNFRRKLSNNSIFCSITFNAWCWLNDKPENRYFARGGNERMEIRWLWWKKIENERRRKGGNKSREEKRTQRRRDTSNRRKAGIRHRETKGPIYEERKVSHTPH